MTVPALSELARRVEAATGPDRELDRQIAEAAAGRVRLGEAFRDAEPHWQWVWPSRDGSGSTSGGWSVAIPAYTASIDAVVALIEEKLPGKSFELHRSGFGGSWARLWDPMTQPGFGADYPRADSKTGPLALLAATLRALSEQDETGRGT